MRRRKQILKTLWRQSTLETEYNGSVVGDNGQLGGSKNWSLGGSWCHLPDSKTWALLPELTSLCSTFFLKLFLLPDLLTHDLQPAQTTQTGLNVTPFHEPAQADHGVTFRMTSNYSCLILMLNLCPKGSTDFICIPYMYRRVSLRDMRDLIPTSIYNDKDPF